MHRQQLAALTQSRTNVNKRDRNSKVKNSDKENFVTKKRLRKLIFKKNILVIDAVRLSLKLRYPIPWNKPDPAPGQKDQ